MNKIIKIFIYFHIFLLFKYLEKYWDKYPIEKKNVIFKTLGFTFLNPHVYSDTVFFLGNFSKSFLILEKYFFGIGATTASFLFFFSIGYLSQYFSKFLDDKKIWKYINIFIILFMFLIALYILGDILNFFTKSWKY